MLRQHGFRAAALAAAVCLLGAGTGRAYEPGLEALSRAFSAGQAQFKALPELPPVMPKNAPTPPDAGAEAFFHALDWSTFPPPDPQTLGWLSSRIPNLAAASVRAVPFETADAVMQRAVDAKATYLDVLSHEIFREKEVYFVSQAALNRLHVKYVSGTVPVQGTTEDGKPFQMQGFVIGQNRVEILYDRPEFTFKEDGHRFKVDNGGRVESTILGPGDVAVDGLYAYGAPIFCPWAKIQRMTKESMYKIKVQSSCGSRGGNDVSPVRVR